MSSAPVEGELVAGEYLTEYEMSALARFFGERDKAVDGIFGMGEVLREIRPRLGHGNWLSWLKAAGVSSRSAQKLMTIARDPKLLTYREAKCDSGESYLPPSQETLYQLTALSEEQFAGLVEAGKIHPEMTRSDLRSAIAAGRSGTKPALPARTQGRYVAILADPPWRFQTRGTGSRAAAERHYPTMELGEIELLRVRDLAADDALLFLWVTSERLADAPRVMQQWGFDLVSTAFIWVKSGSPGLGYWTRKGAELCLLGTRGSPQRLAADVPEVIHAPRRRHSEKPAEVYERIERLVSGPYIELFARAIRPGWDAWGNDPAVQGREQAIEGTAENDPT